MWFGRAKKLSLPTAGDALPGRAQEMEVAARHYVLDRPLKPPFPDGLDQAVFGLGCFWGAERKFWQLDGVYTTAVGYAGGHTHNPTYEEVCSGRTGHAEVVQIAFDPNIITFAELLEVFFTIHDPTTLNRQGADTGTQYRSAIFYHSPAQKEAAAKVIAALDAEKIWDDPIATEIAPLSVFYPAEDYHQNYYAQNANQPYCRAVIAPKVAKARKQFLDKLKK